MVITLLFITLIQIQIYLSYSSCVKNTVFINKSSLAFPANICFFFFIGNSETSAYFSLINVFPYLFFNSISPVYKMGLSFFLRSLKELLVYLKFFNHKKLSTQTQTLKKEEVIFFVVYLQESPS